MFKTKPVAHIKQNDVIVLKSHDGVTRNEQMVIKVEDYENDPGMLKVWFPATSMVLQNGKKVETAPRSFVIFDKKKQIEYKAKDKK